MSVFVLLGFGVLTFYAVLISWLFSREYKKTTELMVQVNRLKDEQINYPIDRRKVKLWECLANDMKNDTGVDLNYALDKNGRSLSETFSHPFPAWSAQRDSSNV